jgi:hypothetical protein
VVDSFLNLKNSIVYLNQLLQFNVLNRIVFQEPYYVKNKIRKVIKEEFRFIDKQINHPVPTVPSGHPSFKRRGNLFYSTSVLYKENALRIPSYSFGS